MAIGSSSYSLVTQRSGQVNLMQVLSGYLRMGQYNLTIEQPKYVRFSQAVFLLSCLLTIIRFVRLSFFQLPDRCYPFVWDLLLRHSEYTAVVDSVLPPEADQLNPNQNLVVRVQFSEPVYYRGSLVERFVFSFCSSSSNRTS